MRHPTLALADTHRVTTAIDGREVELYIFDHHRSAFAPWCHTAMQHGQAVDLITLDRHMDLQPMHLVPPPHQASIAELDMFARHQLACSNDNHIPAAVEAGAIANTVVVARSHPPPDISSFRPYRDHSGTTHRFAFARSLASLDTDAMELLERGGPLILDIDLDCFTTRSDADPDEVLCWDDEHLRSWLLPPDHDRIWNAIRRRVVTITLAREPFHCGGFDRAARLWMRFSRLFFGEILSVSPP